MLLQWSALKLPETEGTVMKTLRVFLVLVAGLLALACGGSHYEYEPTKINHFSRLKDAHMQFLNSYTDKGERVYDAGGVGIGYDQAAREFDKAKSYLENMDNKDGLNAFAYFRAELDKDYRLLSDTEKLFSPSYAAERKASLGVEYDFASAGEYGKVGKSK